MRGGPRHYCSHSGPGCSGIGKISSIFSLAVLRYNQEIVCLCSTPRYSLTVRLMVLFLQANNDSTSPVDLSEPTRFDSAGQCGDFPPKLHHSLSPIVQMSRQSSHQKQIIRVVLPAAQQLAHHRESRLRSPSRLGSTGQEWGAPAGVICPESGSVILTPQVEEAAVTPAFKRRRILDRAAGQQLEADSDQVCQS